MFIFAPELRNHLHWIKLIENYRRILKIYLKISWRIWTKLETYWWYFFQVYINETTDQAILFFTCRSHIAYLNAYMPLNCWVCLFKKSLDYISNDNDGDTLTTIQAVSQNLKQSQYALKFKKNWTRFWWVWKYMQRWETLEKDINKVSKDVKRYFCTNFTKITRRFDNIKMLMSRERRSWGSFKIKE